MVAAADEAGSSYSSSSPYLADSDGSESSAAAPGYAPSLVRAVTALAHHCLSYGPRAGELRRRLCAAAAAGPAAGLKAGAPAAAAGALSDGPQLQQSFASLPAFVLWLWQVRQIDGPAKEHTVPPTHALSTLRVP